MIKSRKQHFKEIEKCVKSLHSYSVPEIISLTITEGSPAYLKMAGGKYKIKNLGIQEFGNYEFRALK